MANREISLAELGDHVDALRDIFDCALASDEESPSIDFGEVQRRARAIDTMISAAPGQANDNPPETSGTPSVIASAATDGRLANDRLPLVLGAGRFTSADRMVAARVLGGGKDMNAAVQAHLGMSDIASPELHSQKKG
jgi:hypothetical protein